MAGNLEIEQSGGAELDTMERSEAKQRALERLLYSAEHSSSPSNAAAYGSGGSFSSRHGDRLLGHDLLGVAMEHLRHSVFKDSEPAATDQAVAVLDQVLSYIEESNFPELYRYALSEFGRVVVDIAEHQPDGAPCLRPTA